AEMLQFAIAGNESFKINLMEANRPGPSFTADTLEEIHTQHPSDEIFLLMGGDSALEFSTWHDPARILRLATLVIKDRPGSTLPNQLELKARLEEKVGVEAKIIVVQGSPFVDISSTDLRSRVQKRSTIRYQVPRAVEVFIEQKKLYK
ncbi:MAG: nicotinate-nicotinamide nucleotide adenylyltransferase, partial [Gemmataceae bacterium]